MERNRPARLLLLAALLPGLTAIAHAQDTKSEPAPATGEPAPTSATTTDAAPSNAADAAAAAAQTAANEAAQAAEAARASVTAAAAATETKPTEVAAPTPATQPAEATAPAAQPTEAVAPAPAPKPVEAPAPKAVEAAAPVAATQPAEATKPAAKPAEPKPATKPAAKPAGDVGSPSLRAAVAGSWRDPKNVARDGYRHPLETLTFFGAKPEQTIIEITPGGGWYSEILAPFLRERGKYVAAVVDPDTQSSDGARKYQTKAKATLEQKFAASPAQYDKVVIAAYDSFKPAFGPADSADLVLTFRNVHNWRSAGQAEVMFRGFYDVLKPGGTLGVVEHRAKADVPADDKSGYVGQAQVIALAEAAGFKLEAKSEINANPRDTKDHPNGVWTLPPVNQHDAADDAKYQAIGESDRMTLRFRKPR
jgi:predicted methyltransferase